MIMLTTMMAVMKASALGGASILLAAALVSLRLGGASASTRHLAWTVALSALVAIPVLELSGLRIEVPMPGGWAARGGSGITVPPVRTAASQTARAIVPERPAGRAEVTNGSSGTTDWPGTTESPGTAESSVTADGFASTAGEGVHVIASEDVERGRALASQGATASIISWIGAMAALWALGAIALLGRVLVSHIHAYRVTARGTGRASPRASRMFAACGLDLGIRRPARLVVSPQVDVPATWGLLRSTVVLPAHHHEWSQETLQRVLLHELAHVRRGDCRSYLVGEVARALHWPNPLAWLALRRQREESERACDDLVLSWGTAPSSYAHDLVRLVRDLKPAPLPRPLLTMTGSSGLGRRVRAILDPHQARAAVGFGTVAAASLAALMCTIAMTVLAPVATAQDRRVEQTSAPAVADPHSHPLEVTDTDELAGGRESGGPDEVAHGEELADVYELGEAVQERPGAQELCVFRDGGSRSTNISMSSDNDVRIRWETDACRVDVEIDGEMEFLPDDSGIASMAVGAVFEIEERFGRSGRRARFEGGPGGSVERRYWVDGSEVAWDVDADRWFAAIVPELFRHTTINAPARVRRLVAEGGPERVFDEVGRMHSDHVASRYLHLLVETTDLEDDDYVRVITLAGQTSSDHSAGELLLAVVERAGMRSAFQEPLLRVAAGLGSDHQKSRVLEVLLDADLSSEQLNAVVATTLSIGSDHNASTVLSAVARSGRSREIDTSAFLDALGQIGSDHNKGVVIEAFLDHGPLDEAEVVRILELTETLGSDHTRGSILQRIAAEQRLTGGAGAVFLRSAADIGSDHQTGMVARGLLAGGDLGEEQVDIVLSLAGGIGSDHERASILLDVIERHELNGGELRRVVETASAIGSDHQQASVLVSLARRHEIAGDARTLYLDLASRMSRHQAEQVRAALAR